MDSTALYRDIADRTDGDIYIGVVGPVRTGKSTWIKRFMELLVLPNIVGEHRRERALDELPQSGAGRTIMTTQPKFVPNEAVEIAIGEAAKCKVRLVDCVGYLVKGVLGLNEGEEARMVRTPWFDHDIPFEDAAELGTRKVIAEHSTIGLVVTTDGSVTELPRSAYVEAEERVIRELKALGKPFVVVLNSATPDDPDTKLLRDALAQKYDVPILLTDVLRMELADAQDILERVLLEFPLSSVHFDLPAWVDALEEEHPLNQEIAAAVLEAAQNMSRVRDHAVLPAAFAALPDVRAARLEETHLNTGAVDYRLDLREGLFYQILGAASGQTVENEAHLMRLLVELSQAKRAYDRVEEALKSAREKGYGLVAPSMEEMTLEQPELVRQGSRFGVRLKAAAPSLHIMRVDIQTEVSPIVGTEQQSEELVKYLLSEFEQDPAGIWNTDMFGKSLSELVREGLAGKLSRMPEDVRGKLRQTLERIINDGSGGVICILL